MSIRILLELLVAVCFLGDIASRALAGRMSKPGYEYKTSNMIMSAIMSAMMMFVAFNIPDVIAWVFVVFAGYYWVLMMILIGHLQNETT